MYRWCYISYSLRYGVTYQNMVHEQKTVLSMSFLHWVNFHIADTDNVPPKKHPTK